MDIKELEDYFEQNNVPDEYYVINELGGGEVDGVGQVNGQWVTYYSERGEKRDIEYFDTENEACKALIEIISEIIKDDTGYSLPKAY